MHHMPVARHWKLMVLFVAAVIAGVAGADYVWRTQLPDARKLSADQVVRLRMRFLFSEAGDEHVVSGPEQIQALLDLLAKGQRAHEHRCADCGELYFDLRDGRSVCVGILVGHHAGFYEFRCDGGIFRVDRAAMFEVMGRAGVGPALLVPLTDSADPRF
jgi:hypothetical protein